MVTLCLVVVILLLLVAGVRLQPSPLSQFELERRRSEGDTAATAALRRDHLLIDVLSLQRILVALLLVLFVILAVTTFGWLYGVLVAVVVALEYGAAAHAPFIQKWGQKLFDRFEPAILHFVEKFASVLRLLRSAAPPAQPKHVDSRQELSQLIADSTGVLSSNEKKLITHSLQFDQQLVRDHMTPRGVIDSISHKELLGPLVLDDLHKTGHSRFPVTDGDIDHVVGILHIQDLLTIDSSRRSPTAQKAMEPRVFYIHQDQTLAHALAAFLKTHHHLFVVINEFRETVGLLSLEDVIEALLGRKIVDEFDLHTDLRAVSVRNPRGNNQPHNRQDI